MIVPLLVSVALAGGDVDGELSFGPTIESNGLYRETNPLRLYGLGMDGRGRAETTGAAGTLTARATLSARSTAFGVGPAWVETGLDRFDGAVSVVARDDADRWGGEASFTRDTGFDNVGLFSGLDSLSEGHRGYIQTSASMSFLRRFGPGASVRFSAGIDDFMHPVLMRRATNFRHWNLRHVAGLQARWTRPVAGRDTLLGGVGTLELTQWTIRSIMVSWPTTEVHWRPNGMALRLGALAEGTGEVPWSVVLGVAANRYGESSELLVDSRPVEPLVALTASHRGRLGLGWKVAAESDIEDTWFAVYSVMRGAGGGVSLRRGRTEVSVDLAAESIRIVGAVSRTDLRLHAPVEIVVQESDRVAFALHGALEVRRSNDFALEYDNLTVGVALRVSPD